METRIVRSRKRAKTVSAREVDGVFEVRAPAHMSDSELEPVVQKLMERWQRRRDKQALSDADLERRARELNRQYFNGKLRWQSVRWVDNQNTRFGSCTPGQGTIRISHRLATMPGFVLDYVLVHELAHLLEANHGASFWRLVNQYPRTERARGYLMAAGLEIVED
ncbi:MAG: M48 family metallopeptidase [Anaerolineae bacterium]|nr:M48 family metallopeptidase [Anaerolineae bacterium]MCB9130956.1 M48 family metallopeptidase [Anaerolineales bacterium]MCB0230274.1 M48 family metallopeptidase [Anaerolineae bacterium]MCB0236080.1 M48 family metallopeptidase [Anaerolineae bacterium]MCB0239809.1 M48 family metallopeptidase [Anaerolineae bacterium]